MLTFTAYMYCDSMYLSIVINHCFTWEVCKVWKFLLRKEYWMIWS